MRDAAWKQKKKDHLQAKNSRKDKSQFPIPFEERVKLLVSDVADLQEIPAASIDWIITDPPYPKKYLPVFTALGQTAARVLKEGGSCLVMVGQMYFLQVYQALSQYLQYHWIISYDTPGGFAPQIWPKKVLTYWKPVLWFTKGEYTRENWIGDKVKGKPNDRDKRFHKWGQSESGMADLVYRFTDADDVILDPFVGGGTTAVVTLRLPGCRRFIGADIDPAQIQVTQDRIIMERQNFPPATKIVTKPLF